MRLPLAPSRLCRCLPVATLLTVAATSAFAQKPAPARPPLTGIAAIVLSTQNMAAEKAFYTHTLGMDAIVSAEYSGGVSFFGNPRQQIDVVPATSATALAYNHVAWATTDAEAMRRYLASKGVVVPAAITVTSNGDKYFRVHDPEGNIVEFLERPAGMRQSPGHPAALISGRIIHTGFMVRSAATEDHFYRDILGFHLYWEGGMHPGTLDWVSMQVPDGTDWVEYMLNAGDHPSAHTIGVDDHFSLGVENMDAVVAALEKRGFPPGQDQQHQKQAGKDGKYQLNLYDPDGTRIEFMEFKPYTQPCCHAFEGRQPGPDQQ